MVFFDMVSTLNKLIAFLLVVSEAPESGAEERVSEPARSGPLIAQYGARI